MNLNSKLKSRRLMFARRVIVFLILNLNTFVVNVKANGQNFTFIYRDYLRNMMKNIDGEVQPCMNFFQHTCGNFENFQNVETISDESAEEFLDSNPDVVPFLYNKQDYYTFFESHKQDFNTTPGILVRNVYDLCKNYLQQTSGKRKMWLRMISDIPFLKHDHDLLKKWPFLQYQWDKYEAQLDLGWPALAAEFSARGFNTVFHIFFAENTMFVAPNDELKCPDPNELRPHFLPLLRKRNAQIADIISTELWLLCRQLKGEVAISDDTVKISSLVIEKEFFLRLLLRLNFTDFGIENTRKVNANKLNEIMSILCVTNPRIVYNFIIWQAYQKMINIDDCFQLANEFDSLLQVEYWNWYAFKSHFSRDVALASYLFHTTRFQKHYRHFVISTTWERLFQSRFERKDLNIERSIKNYVKQYLDLERYSNAFHESEFFFSEKPTFYSYLLEMRRLKIRYTFLNPYDDIKDLHFFKEFINFSILLIYRPLLHYFASYDLEMWQNSKVLENSDGLYAALDCLTHQTELHLEDASISERELNMDLVNDIFNFYAAFIEAWSDYKFWLESENFAIAEDFILEYFKLNSQQVMFYAVAQQFCSRNDFIYKTLINRSYMNMPQFQAAFECSSSDQMNPLIKCMIKQCL